MRLNSKKYLIFIIGIAILTLGVSLTVKSNLGAGSYDSINFALAEKLNINVSVAICGTAFIALILSAIIKKGLPRITTFITSMIMGIFTDVWVSLLGNLNVETVVMKAVVFSIGMTLVCFGIALYLLPKLPPNPVDDLMVTLNEVTDLKLGTAKLIIDFVCIVLAFLLKGPIGIGTVLLTFLVGPIVNIFHNRLCKYIKIEETDECIV
ncbi:MAG: YczE/YyaS/YitT family protein [Peptostreptococcaceae bacterium]